jgi:Flp pilus assembly protein TadG
MNRAPKDTGAVTAEFAVVLPSVFLVLAVSVLSISAQVERLKLVSVAGMISRAVARGEPQASIQQGFAGQLEGREWQISNLGNFVCVELSRQVGLASLPDFALRLAETQCARKVGL